MNTASDTNEYQQRDNNWLSPPVSNNFRKLLEPKEKGSENYDLEFIFYRYESTSQ
jgi:hypothetical protein